MRFLYNHTTKTQRPVMQAQTLDENLEQHPINPDHSTNIRRDLDTRDEPLISAQAVDQERLLKAVDDPTTDPEGAANRASSSEAFPAWVLEEYRLSKSTYWGKPNADGKEHLIPKESLVKAVIQVHIDGEATIGKMLDLSLGATNAVNYKTMMESYELMFMTMDKNYLYPMMNGLSNMTRAAFAERAFTKYSFLSALARQKPDTDLPEYMDFLKERMLQAATMCGTLVAVHSKMWSIMEYKNSPTYLVDNEIKLKLCQNAKFLETRNKPVEAPKPSAEDQRSLAALC